MFTKEHMSSLRKCLFSCSFFSPCFWQRIYLLIPKKQNSEKYLPLPLQEHSYNKTFSILLSPLPMVGPSICTLSQSRLTSRNCWKGTWHGHVAHAFCYTSLAGQWNLLCSFLLSVEIYWKIFSIAKHLKVLSQGSSSVYLLEKYWIEKKKFSPQLWSKHGILKNFWITLKFLGYTWRYVQRKLNPKLYSFPKMVTDDLIRIA